MVGTAFSFDSARFGQDGAVSITWSQICDVDHINQLLTALGIMAVFVTTSVHAGATGALKLRWRNFTDNPSGSFVDLVTGSGELRAGASAGAITNADPVGSSAGCQTSIDDSEEVENESPLFSGTQIISQNNFSETQWCINFSFALNNKEYEFEVFDDSASAIVGTVNVTVTTEAAPAGNFDKINGVTEATLSKVNGIDKANINKINGINKT